MDTTDGGTAPEADEESLHLYTGVLVLMFILLCLAVGILVVLGFTKRRKKCCQECCNGRPGLITPVNLHHTGRHRLIYAIIFGAMSNVFLHLALADHDINLCGPTGWRIGTVFCRTVISPVIVVFLICLLYAPVFACVDAPLPIVGHVLGLLYTTGLVIFSSMTYGLAYKSVDFVAVYVLSDAPFYTFFVVILVWYFYQLGKDILVVLKISNSNSDGESVYYFKYVTNLLRKKPPSSQTWIGSCLSCCWPYNKYFRFPLKFLAPLTVMITVLFKLSFLVFVQYIMFADTLVTLWKDNGQSIAQNLSLNYDAILDSLKGFYASGVVAAVLTFVLCLILLIRMAAVVHKDLELAAQGTIDIYPGKPPPRAFILSFSLKYSGYQIGHFIWAWVIYYFAFFVIGCAAVGIILGLKYYSSIIVPVIIPLIISPIFFLMVALGETLMCKFVFLEGKEGKFFMITNKNAFHWFSYFVFLFNAIVGIWGGVLRVLLAMLFGILLLFRLDSNIMMRGFQFADLGNRIYRGFLYVEHTYSNYVVNAFVALVSEGRQKRSVFGNSINADFGKPYGSLGGGVRNKRQIRNHWLVAYTLVHNPSLCQLRVSRQRGHELQNREEEEGEWAMDETRPLLRFK